MIPPFVNKSAQMQLLVSICSLTFLVPFLFGYTYDVFHSKNIWSSEENFDDDGAADETLSEAEKCEAQNSDSDESNSADTSADATSDSDAAAESEKESDV